MTTPPDEIRIRCPRCGAEYDAWQRESMNLELDEFERADLEDASSASCPVCGLKVSFDGLEALPDGTWTIGGPGGEEAEDGWQEGEEFDGEGEVWDEEEEEDDEEDWDKEDEGEEWEDEEWEEGEGDEDEIRGWDEEDEGEEGEEDRDE